MGEFVNLTVSEGVGTIRLDRPKMNALNVQVQEEIRVAAVEATGNDDVRAVVIYGGERVFAAGADIKEMADMSYADMAKRSGPLQSSLSAVAAIPKPTVAAITGYALGGGCELALCADYRIAADDAKLGQPEILLGIIPGAGGTQRLSRLVGPSKAKDLIYTGRFVDAAESLQIGLVDKVVPGRRGVRRGRCLGVPVRPRRGDGAARGQGVDRLRTGRRPDHRAGDRAPAVRGAVRHRGPRDRDEVLRRERSWQSRVQGNLMSATSKPAASAEDIEAAWNDNKLAQVLYHDWEASTYDEKWSISYDERCVDYARDRFTAVAGTDGWPYGKTLEIGAGTGFFTLNLKLAGVLDEAHVTDLSPGMVEAAKKNAKTLGFAIEGKVADAEKLPYDDDTFDLVIGHAVIHHIPDVELAFREMLRVLKPGGRFVICGEPTRYGDFVARRLSRLHLVGDHQRDQAARARALAAVRRRSSTSRRGLPRWRPWSTCTRSTRTRWRGWRRGPVRWR